MKKSMQAYVAALTIEEKAQLTTGTSFWATAAAGDLPAALLNDGPHGVRAQTGAADHLGISASEPATCFPPAAGLAQAWDEDLVRRVGEALGVEARHYGVGVLLGPGVNIRRDPRGGRNFEYYSEDPHLSGRLGAAWVEGVQSRGVGASVKHFAANNAETDRMRSDSRIDARTLHEIYLRGFKHIVRHARPWTVMCSYNKLNGVPVPENRWLLTDVLRGHWGFDGVVVSDWGAIADRVAALHAGTDLQMPGGGEASVNAVKDAVASGALGQDELDTAATNVVTLLERVADGASSPTVAVDFDAHHALAREAASRSITLLKNEMNLLPLPTDRSVAVIGTLAVTPRFQGAGSSRVNATRVDIPLDEIRAATRAPVTYAPGVATSDATADPQALLAEAVDAARAADIAVVFAGLGEGQESEGFDREDIELPADQVDMIRAVAAAAPATVVVLTHGGVLRLAPITREVPAILDAALLGQAGGAAVADVLFGRVNPSGKLTETVPVRLADAPSYLNFPGEHSQVLYGESLFVGYRGYDARDIPVSFPFGHGLSYTTFEYTDLHADAQGADVRVSVRITNTGPRAGREIVQFYASRAGSSVRRAPRELKAFASVDLEQGESSIVSALIARDDFAHWDDRSDQWLVEGGEWAISAAASSRDIRATATVSLAGDDLRPLLTESSTMSELMADPTAGPYIAQMLGGRQDNEEMSDSLGIDLVRMMGSIPLDRVAGFSGGTGDTQRLRALLDHANAARSGTSPVQPEEELS